MTEIDYAAFETADTFPKRVGMGGNSPGRKREFNPMDEHLVYSYSNKKVLRYPLAMVSGDKEALRTIQAKARASADYLGYGIDTQFDPDGTLVIQARDRRVVQRKPKE